MTEEALPEFVALCYKSASRVEVVELREVKYDFEVNPLKQTWSWREFRDIPVGQARRGLGFNEERYGLIGIYDPLQVKHLNSMIWDSEVAIRPQGSVLED